MTAILCLRYEARASVTGNTCGIQPPSGRTRKHGTLAVPFAPPTTFSEIPIDGIRFHYPSHGEIRQARSLHRRSSAVSGGGIELGHYTAVIGIALIADATRSHAIAAGMLTGDQIQVRRQLLRI
jgi:hypothetical protein